MKWSLLKHFDVLHLNRPCVPCTLRGSLRSRHQRASGHHQEHRVCHRGQRIREWLDQSQPSQGQVWKKGGHHRVGSIGSGCSWPAQQSRTSRHSLRKEQQDWRCATKCYTNWSLKMALYVYLPFPDPLVSFQHFQKGNCNCFPGFFFDISKNTQGQKTQIIQKPNNSPPETIFLSKSPDSEFNGFCRKFVALI